MAITQCFLKSKRPRRCAFRNSASKQNRASRLIKALCELWSHKPLTVLSDLLQGSFLCIAGRERIDAMERANLKEAQKPRSSLAGKRGLLRGSPAALFGPLTGTQKSIQARVWWEGERAAELVTFVIRKICKREKTNERTKRKRLDIRKKAKKDERGRKKGEAREKDAAPETGGKGSGKKRNLTPADRLPPGYNEIKAAPWTKVCRHK